MFTVLQTRKQKIFKEMKISFICLSYILNNNFDEIHRVKKVGRYFQLKFETLKTLKLHNGASMLKTDNHHRFSTKTNVLLQIIVHAKRE